MDCRRLEASEEVASPSTLAFAWRFLASLLDMSKTIFITGATDGLGKLAATMFARAGHHVILHGRNKEKLEDVLSELEGLNVEGRVAELEAFMSIKTMVRSIEEDVDILINNAGVFNSDPVRDLEEIDRRFKVNYLAPFLLTTRILTQVKERIINLSSAAQDAVDIAALTRANDLSFRQTYGQSKLALTMWSFWLAKECPELDVVAVNPGSLLDTKMVHEAYGQVWSKADKGAEILYELALDEKHNGKSGVYFDNDLGDYNAAHPDAYDESKIANLINWTEEYFEG